MVQKVVQIGNSAGVVIPQTIRKSVGLKVGSQVEIKETKNGLSISPMVKSRAHGVDPMFIKMVDDFANEHKDVLRELADR